MPPLQRTTNASPELVRMSASKTVSFRSTVQCVWTISLDNYTEEEKQNAFYSSSEQETIRDRMRSDLALVLAGTPPRDFEIRGMEAFFPKASATRQIRRALAWDEVMMEQKRQWEERVYDADIIADVYRIATQDSLVEARCHAVNKDVLCMDEEDDVLVAPHMLNHADKAHGSFNLHISTPIRQHRKRPLPTCPAA
jgi:hypothetical protein